MQRIELNQVVCQRRGEALFQPLSFSVTAGELAVISGPNGAGKTTFLECLAGLTEFVSGSKKFNLQNSELSWGQCSHYLGHKLANKAALSCLENLKFTLAIDGKKVSESDIESTLDTVGLAGYEYQLASELSAGQKKRLALSRLLLLEKTFWLLDEPFVNLDHEGCEWLYGMIAQHIDSGGAVILTAHDQKKIHQMAQHHVTLEPIT